MVNIRDGTTAYSPIRAILPLLARSDSATRSETPSSNHVARTVHLCPESGCILAEFLSLEVNHHGNACGVTRQMSSWMLFLIRLAGLTAAA